MMLNNKKTSSNIKIGKVNNLVFTIINLIFATNFRMKTPVFTEKSGIEFWILTN